MRFKVRMIIGEKGMEMVQVKAELEELNTRASRLSPRLLKTGII